jgi:hypothetical protein
MAMRADLARDAFERVYSNDAWGLAEMKSDPSRNEHAAALITGVMNRQGLTSMTELGCGFWSYARLVDWNGKTYDGYDVFPGSVKWNNDLYAAPNIRFHLMEEGVSLAPADLLFSKDVLQHLPTSEVLHFLALFKTSFRYMLILNDINSEHGTNTDIAHGGHRGIRLDLPPFNEACEVLDDWVLQECPTYTKRACLLRGLVAT